jgi:hypothetical protein
MKTLWAKIARLPASWKAEAKARKKRQKNEWLKCGELRNVKVRDRRFVRAA